MADLYCRCCGDELSAEEYGSDECDACAADREPWDREGFYSEEQEV